MRLQCLVLFCLIFSRSPCLGNEQYVTYEFSGGRFGDNLLSYLHAKWLAYQKQIPLLYKPFPYSAQFRLHDLEIICSPELLRRCVNVPIHQMSDFINHSDFKSCIYVCHYFPESEWERINLFNGHGTRWECFQVDWKEPKFRQIVQEAIAPKWSYSLVSVPEGRVGIAIHMREGGGFDTEDVGLKFFTKVPPLDFYLNGLRKVLSLIPNHAYFCYLFTDATDPLRFIEQFKQALPSDTDIVFECRSHGNVHDQNVLEDFFSLFQFDVLIHPESNFSVIPSLIHDYAITYSPVSGSKFGGHVVIDKVKLCVNDALMEKFVK